MPINPYECQRMKQKIKNEGIVFKDRVSKYDFLRINVGYIRNNTWNLSKLLIYNFVAIFSVCKFSRAIYDDLRDESEDNIP